MKCPACDHQLTEIQAGDVLVDVCQGGCGGVWFDEFELKKFDEPHEFAAQAIFDNEEAIAPKVDHSRIRYCPVCEEEELCRRYYDVKNEVEVDQCLSCSGIWLDLGELKAIRSQYTTEQERIKAADSYLDGLLANTEKALEQETKEKLEQIKSESSIRGQLRTFFRSVFNVE